MNVRYQEIEIISPNYGPVMREKFTGNLVNAPGKDTVTNDEVVGHMVTGHGWQKIEDGIKVNGQLMDGVCTGIYDDLGNPITPAEYRLVDPIFKKPPFAKA